MIRNIKIVTSHSLLSVNECWDLSGHGVGRGVREESSEPRGLWGRSTINRESHRGGRQETHRTVYIDLLQNYYGLIPLLR